LPLQQQFPEAVDSIVADLFAKGDDLFRTSVVSREEGEFLRKLAACADIKDTLEIGFANGISTLYICSGLASKPNPSHTAIDPAQMTLFRGNGIANVKRAGFDFLRFIEAPSEVALPRLMQEGATFDLALIDGWHTADQTMLDFYYVDRMMPPGGIVVIDDATMPAVNKIIHYVAKIPNYKLIGTSGRRGVPRKIINYAKASASVPCWPLKKLFGEKLMREFVDDGILNPGKLWTLDSCSMVAFRKTEEYERDNMWYEGM
jgi:predicted O-methyltransferase YrrM